MRSDISKRKQHPPAFKAKVALKALKGESETDLDLIRVIDKQFLETPVYGVRQMTCHLRNEDRLVNEKRIRRLMRLSGLMPVYQKPNTSKAAKGHKIYPYLLRGLRVDRPVAAFICPYLDASRCLQRKHLPVTDD